MFISLFGPNLGHKMSKGEQGAKSYFKGKNQLKSPEPLKQLWALKYELLVLCYQNKNLTFPKPGLPLLV